MLRLVHEIELDEDGRILTEFFYLKDGDAKIGEVMTDKVVALSALKAEIALRKKTLEGLGLNS